MSAWWYVLVAVGLGANTLSIILLIRRINGLGLVLSQPPINIHYHDGEVDS